MRAGCYIKLQVNILGAVGGFDFKFSSVVVIFTMKTAIPRFSLEPTIGCLQCDY